jgi:hypothetical protein
MATYEAGLIGSLPARKLEVSANPDKDRFANVSLTQILRDTAGAISRRVMWMMELLAVMGLLFCLSLMSAVHGGLEALALGLAAIYFSFSVGLGAYLLRVDLADNRGRR